MDWKYIAGFFDAEGTIFYDIKIVNTNREVLEKIKNFIGYGKIYVCEFKNNQQHFGKKPIYILQISKRKFVISFITNILNYSIIKRKELMNFLLATNTPFKVSTPKISYSYLAGLIDGDGSISKTKDGLWHISISLTNKEVLDKIKDFVIKNAPNYVGVRKKAEVYKASKENMYTLRIGNQKILAFLLKRLIPHLIIKKAIATKALNTLKIRENYKFLNYTKEELKRILEDYYINQKLSIRQIARKFNVNYSTIHQWLIKFNIPRREKPPEKIHIPKEELIKLYVKEGKSASEIARIYNVAHTTILDKLRKFGIEPRNDKKLKDIPNLKEKLTELYINQGKTMEAIAKEFGVTKEAIYRWIKKFGLKKEIPAVKIEKDNRKLREIPKEELKQILTDLYLNKGLSLSQIAEIYGVTKQNIRNWLLKLGIPLRKHTQPVKVIFDKIYINIGEN